MSDIGENNNRGSRRIESSNKKRSQTPLLGLTETQKHEIIGLFQRYAKENSGDNAVIGKKFLEYIADKDSNLLKATKTHLGRNVKVSDLGFLSVKADQVSSLTKLGSVRDSHGGLQFLGVQLAYIEKYRDVLKERNNGFTGKQQRSFERIVADALDKSRSFETLMQTIQERKKHHVGLRVDQIEKLDSAVKSVGVQDIIEAVKTNHFLTKEEKAAFSINGDLTASSEIRQCINDATALYMRTIVDRQKSLDKKVFEFGESFATPTFENVIAKALGVRENLQEDLLTVNSELATLIENKASKEEIAKAEQLALVYLIQEKDVTLANIMRDMIAHKNDISMCGEQTQRNYFSLIKKERKGSENYKQMGKWFCEQTKLISTDQLDSIVDQILDPKKDNIIIYLNGGTEYTIPCKKYVLGTVGELDHTSVVERFNAALPLQLVMDDNTTYNLGEARNLTSVISNIALIVHDNQQTEEGREESANERKEYKDSVVGDKLGNLLLSATRDANSTDEDKTDSDIVDGLFETKEQGVVKIVPSFSEEVVKANLLKNDAEKIAEGISLLNQFAENANWFSSLPKTQQELIKKAITAADLCTVYNDGDSIPDGAIYSYANKKWYEQGTIKGKPATGYFYTNGQIKRKAQILKDAGLDRGQIRLLLRAGITGTPTQIEQGLAEEKAKLTYIKTEKENALQVAKNNLIQAEKTGVGGSPSLQEFKKRIRKIENDLKNKNDILKDIGLKKNDRVARNAMSQTDRDDYLQHEMNLQEEVDALLHDKHDAEDKLQEFQSSLKPLQDAVSESERDLKGTKDDIKKLEEKISTLQNGEYFDWTQESPEARAEFYEKKKKEYEQLKKDEEEKYKKMVEENTALVDPTEDEIRIRGEKLKDQKEKVDKRDVALTNLEARYNGIKNAKDEEKKKFDKESTEGKLGKSWDSVKGYNKPTQKDPESSEKLTDLPETGDQIFLKYHNDDGELNFGKFGGLWLRCVIDKVDKKTGKISMRAYGVSGPLTVDGKSVEGDLLTYDSPEAFEKFLKGGKREEQIKMPKYDSSMTMKDRGVQLKKSMGDSSYSFPDDIKKRVQNLITQVDFSSMKKQSADGKKEEHIQYMGRPITADNGSPDRGQERYKVSFPKTGVVKISEPMSGNKKEREMTYDSFLLFCADKGLQPFSQEDVNEMNAKTGITDTKDYIDQGVQPGLQDEGVIDKNRKKGLFGRNRTSIKALKGGYKKIFDGLKKKLDDRNKEDEEKLIGMMVNSGWMKKLAGAGIPLVSEVLDDMSAGALSEGDRAKKKKIDEFEKEPENFKDTTPGGAFDYIETILFQNPKKARKNLLKVAGYFQYCCTKGDLYPRALAKYKGQGMWIKLLAGDEFQTSYLHWYKQQELLLAKDPENLDLKNRVLYGEAYYISKVINDRKFPGAKIETNNFDPKTKKAKTKGDMIVDQFGSIYSKAWMGGILDTAITGGLGAAEKIASKKSDLNKKEYENFNTIYAEIFGNFENKSLTGGMGHLEPMARKMKKSEDNYNKRSMAMLYPILSGQMANGLTESAIKSEYLGLTRQYAFPLGLYAWGTPNGREELIKLLTIFEAKVGKPEKGIAKIVAELGDKQDSKSLGEFTKAIKERWLGEKDGVVVGEGVGKGILGLMTNPQKLFDLETEIKENKSIDGKGLETQEAANYSNVLGSYINDKFMDKEVADVPEGGKLDAIALKKNVWSLSPGFTRSMWQRRGTQFDSKVIEHVPGIWNELTSQLKDYAKKKDSLTQREVGFLVNKFFMFTEASGATRENKEFLYSLFAPRRIVFQPAKGKGGASGAPVEGDVLKKVIIKGIDKKSIEGNTLPLAIKNNLFVRVDIFNGASVKKHLPGLIKEDKIPQLEDVKPLLGKLSNGSVNAEQQAVEYFQNVKYKNYNTQKLQTEFGEGDASFMGYGYGDDDY